MSARMTALTIDNKKETIKMKLFFATLITGILSFTGGYYIGKKNGIKIADEKVKEMEEYYQRTDEYKRSEEPETKDETRDDSVNQKDIKDRIKETVKKTTDYTKYYTSDEGHSSSNKDDTSKKEDPKTAAKTMDSDKWKNLSPAEKAIQFHEEHRDQKPEVVFEWGDDMLPVGYDMNHLYYYPEKDTLCTEEEEEIEDPETFLGEALTESGFVEDADFELMWVINYQLDCVYEVQKVW